MFTVRVGLGKGKHSTGVSSCTYDPHPVSTVQVLALFKRVEGHGVFGETNIFKSTVLESPGVMTPKFHSSKVGLVVVGVGIALTYDVFGSNSSSSNTPLPVQFPVPVLVKVNR